jgi:thiol-disulfide isomerase/thioredoxin
MIRKILAMAFLAVTTAAFSNAEELAVGATAPGFSLTNVVDGSTVSFVPDDGKVKVVVFTCNGCPYAKAFEDRIVSIGRDYAKRGVAFYALDPNDDQQYPVETSAVMKQRAAAKNYPFPYLKDGDSRIAGTYGARVTPHVFLVDGSGVIRYRGYVDDSAKEKERSHAGLSDALDAVLAKQPIKVTATRAFGCSIKWKNQG